MKLSNLVENSGKLMGVKSYSFSELPNEIAAIDLSFERCGCFIRVVEDTDEIAVSSTPDLVGLVESRMDVAISGYKGLELLWAWGLMNNQGYSDGLRLQFKNKDVAVEFVVEASSIKQYLVSKV